MEPQDTADSWAASMTEDPFCAREGVKVLQSTGHTAHLWRIIFDLQMHIVVLDLPYTVVHDLLIKNIPLKAGVAPDILFLPGRLDLETVEIPYWDLAVDSAPDLILEIVGKKTYEADAIIKYDIYRLAGVGEYWLYNPNGYGGGPPLQGWRRKDAEYLPIPGRTDEVAGKEATLYPSAVLKTDWGLAADTVLRLRDPERNDWYDTTPKAMIKAQNRLAEAKARTAKARSRLAEAKTRTAQARSRLAEAKARTARAKARANEAERTLKMLRDSMSV